MYRIFGVLFAMLALIAPSMLFAGMSQAEVDKINIKPIILGPKKYTFDVRLPVDSTNGYRWFLITPDHDYIDDQKYKHNSVDVENSKWGGMDNFKLKLTKKFKNVPHKIVLHFECLKPWKNSDKPLVKDVTVLSLVD